MLSSNKVLGPSIFNCVTTSDEAAICAVVASIVTSKAGEFVKDTVSSLEGNRPSDHAFVSAQLPPDGLVQEIVSARSGDANVAV